MNISIIAKDANYKLCMRIGTTYEGYEQHASRDCMRSGMEKDGMRRLIKTHNFCCAHDYLWWKILCRGNSEVKTRKHVGRKDEAIWGENSAGMLRNMLNGMSKGMLQEVLLFSSKQQSSNEFNNVSATAAWTLCGKLHSSRGAVEETVRKCYMCSSRQRINAYTNIWKPNLRGMHENRNSIIHQILTLRCLQRDLGTKISDCVVESRVEGSFQFQNKIMFEAGIKKCPHLSREMPTDQNFSCSWHL